MAVVVRRRRRLRCCCYSCAAAAAAASAALLAATREAAEHVAGQSRSIAGRNGFLLLPRHACLAVPTWTSGSVLFAGRAGVWIGQVGSVGGGLDQSPFTQPGWPTTFISVCTLAALLSGLSGAVPEQLACVCWAPVGRSPQIRCQRIALHCDRSRQRQPLPSRTKQAHCLGIKGI